MFHIFFAATGNGRSFSLLRVLCEKKAQWRQWPVYKADQKTIPEAHGGSVSFNVTGPFPFLRPWHCVEVSLLPPCTCRRESLPRRRLAQRARSRAFGNLSNYARFFTPTFEKACAACWKNHSFLRRFCCASGLRVCHSVQEFGGLTRPHPSVMRCLSILVAPMCFCFSPPCFRAGIRGTSETILTASWCSRGPFHLLFHYLGIMSKTCYVTYTLTIGLSFSLFASVPGAARLRQY